MKQVAGRLRLDLAQYRELEAFAAFASDLDAATKKQLDRGVRLVEVMKQGQYVPQPVERQVAIIYAATTGFLDALPVSALQKYEHDLYAYLEAKHPGVLQGIREKKEITDDLKPQIEAALSDFAKIFTA